MSPNLIDLAIIALLAGTIGYAWLIDRRVRALMTALRDIAPMVSAFSEAVDRSEHAAERMRGVAERAPAPEEPEDKFDLVKSFFDMTKTRQG